MDESFVFCLRRLHVYYQHDSCNSFSILAGIKNSESRLTRDCKLSFEQFCIKPCAKLFNTRYFKNGSRVKLIATS